MLIYLIRHGETPAGRAAYNKEKRRPDPELTSLGSVQAERTGLRLADTGIGHLYASDLIRTLRTAEPIARHTGLPILLRPALREIDMGRLHHAGWEHIRKDDPVFHDLWHRHISDLPYPDGETGEQAAVRAMPVLREAIAGGTDAAIVTHGGTIRCILCAVLGMPQERRFLLGPVHNCGITVLQAEGDTISLVGFNDVGHLMV